MPSTTTTTGHALLGLIALRPRWSTYELAGQVTRSLRLLWPRAESRVYDEAKALVRRGLLKAEADGKGRRPRTVYTISDAGQDELASWLATPSSATRLQSDALLRVLLGRLGTRTQLRASINRIHQDADALFEQGRLTGQEYLSGTAEFSDDVAYRALVFDFLFHHATMLREWADRAETTIADWAGDESQAAQAGIERIRTLVDRLPPSRPDV